MGCSTSASTRLAMKRAVRTGVPVRVTSVTSTTPRRLTTSTRRPARVATTSYVRVAPPASIMISTLSPFMRRTLLERPFDHYPGAALLNRRDGGSEQLDDGDDADEHDDHAQRERRQ